MVNEWLLTSYDSSSVEKQFLCLTFLEVNDGGMPF